MTATRCLETDTMSRPGGSSSARRWTRQPLPMAHGRSPGPAEPAQIRFIDNPAHSHARRRGTPANRPSSRRALPSRTMVQLSIDPGIGQACDYGNGPRDAVASYVAIARCSAAPVIVRVLHMATWWRRIPSEDFSSTRFVCREAMPATKLDTVAAGPWLSHGLAGPYAS